MHKVHFIKTHFRWHLDCWITSTVHWPIFFWTFEYGQSFQNIESTLVRVQSIHSWFLIPKFFSLSTQQLPKLGPPTHISKHRISNLEESPRNKHCKKKSTQGKRQFITKLPEVNLANVWQKQIFERWKVLRKHWTFQDPCLCKIQRPKEKTWYAISSTTSLEFKCTTIYIWKAC